MCMVCTYKRLEQLRWELVVQEQQLLGNKVSPEVMESAKTCADESGGLMMPRMKLDRPPRMDSQMYAEATEIFKRCMTEKRQAQIAAISILMDLLENEVLPFPPQEAKKVVHISAAEVLQGPPDERESYEP